ncbi:MAG: DUF362 domain-containing protein [Candidatus Sumerlaeota bacterium]|nr:DUF362 domain-containing protein [Candidatus Sumerlaeota bacterium]
MDVKHESETPNKLSRREFLWRVGAAGAVAAAGVGGAIALHQPKHCVPGISNQSARLPQLRKFNVERSASDVALSVAHGDDVEAMVRAAIGELGGMGKFIQKGDKVVLKPNVAFDRPPALGATTSPEVLRAVARLVQEAGASEIRILDNPINQPEGCFAKSGITQAAKDLAGAMKVSLVLPAESLFETVHIGGVALGDWPMLLRPLLDADKVIGIAPAKDHNLCHASMTMKNWYGLLGGRRNQFHQDIYNVVADLAFMMTPTLVVLDGSRVLMRNGPTGGSLADVKAGRTIIAGVDAVAVDACGVETLLERDVAKVEYLQRAHDRGIGRMDWRALNWKEAAV